MVHCGSPICPLSKLVLWVTIQEEKLVLNLKCKMLTTQMDFLSHFLLKSLHFISYKRADKWEAPYAVVKQRRGRGRKHWNRWASTPLSGSMYASDFQSGDEIWLWLTGELQTDQSFLLVISLCYSNLHCFKSSALTLSSDPTTITQMKEQKYLLFSNVGVVITTHLTHNHSISINGTDLD